jgi:hypothetical protein
MAVSSQIYNANPGVATVFSPTIETPEYTTVGIVIQHPAGVTTTYSVEGSSTPQNLFDSGAGIWGYWDLRDRDGNKLDAAAKSAAETFTLSIVPPFKRIRIKMVTTVAGGNKIVIEQTSKIIVG